MLFLVVHSLHGVPGRFDFGDGASIDRQLGFGESIACIIHQDRVCLEVHSFRGAMGAWTTIELRMACLEMTALLGLLIA